MNFLCSGKKGDLIMSLYIVKRMGGGIVYLGNKYFEEPIDAIMRDLSPLIALQPYVQEVRPYEPGMKIDVDLDLFKRDQFLYDSPLLHVMSRAQGLDLEPIIGAWIDVPPMPGFEDKIVIHRRVDPRGRPANPGFRWDKLFKLFGRERIIFVGRLQSEWEAFNYDQPVEWLCPKDNLEHARIIRSSRLFVGSQSFPAALADAMDRERIIELAPALYSRNFMNDYSPRCWYHLHGGRSRLRDWRWADIGGGAGVDLLTGQKLQLPSREWSPSIALDAATVECLVLKSQAIEYLRHWLVSKD